MKLYCVTIQMKAIEQYFHVVLFIMLHKVVATFNSGGETLVCTIRMKAIEQNVPKIPTYRVFDRHK